MYKLFVMTILLSIVLLTPARVLAQIPETRHAGLTVLESSGTGVVFELKVPDYSIKEITQGQNPISEIIISGSTKTSDPGKPQLPMMSALIGIPADAALELILLDDRQSEINRDLNLSAVPQVVGLDEDLSTGMIQALTGSKDAANTDWYPSSSVRIADVGWLRNQRVARIEFYPFQYRPSDGQVIWHTHLQVRVRFGMEPVGQPDWEGVPVDIGLQRENPFEDSLRQNLVNYEDARRYRTGIPAHELGSLSQTTWMDAGEPRYRIEVDQDGLFQLTYAALQTAGLDVAHIDPTLLHLTSQGEAVAIFVENEDGNVHLFSPGENIYFYGQKFYGDRLAELYAAEATNYLAYPSQLPDGTATTWYPEFNAKMLEKYTDTNVYWLSLGVTPGARMQVVDATAHDTAPVPTSYTATVHAEQSRYWYTHNFSSEDTWYWDDINTTGERTYSTTLTGLSTDVNSAIIRGEMAARADNIYNNPDHHTRLWINSQATPFDDMYWDGISRYRFEEIIPRIQLVEGSNTVRFQMFLDSYSGQLTDRLYFDWFEIEYSRRFQAQNDRISFSRNETNTTWQYQISGFSSPGAYVLDITAPTTPRWLVNQRFVSGVLSYEGRHPGAGSYLAVGTNSVQNPKSISYYQPPDLLSTSNNYDYLFITHSDFIAAAQQLANFRASQGFTTLIVDVNDLYNEFNFGIFHSIAIKNFLAYTFTNWADPPFYVLLIGDGHWNFKGYERYNAPPIYMPPHLSWTDPIQGEVDSANMLAAVVGTDPLPDVLIGRLPVNSVSELNAATAKIISYEQSTLQGWQKKVIFIADNVPDPAGDFVEASERIISDYIEPGFDTIRIFENNYNCPGAGCPQVKQAIISTINTSGAFFINFTGHGAVNRWTHESIFTNSDIASLTNATQLPVILSLTCLDGYWIHPGETPNPSQSLIEEIVRAPSKGAVAAFAPTGLGVATGHDEIWRGFYDSTFRDGDWNLGEATLSSKLRLYATGGNLDLLHTYTIFGDPALKIKTPYKFSMTALPDGQIHLPGSIVQRTIRITNSGLVPDTFDVTTSGNKWVVVMPDTIGPVAAGATLDVPVRIYTPFPAPDGSYDTVVITLTSQGNHSNGAQTTLVTTVNIDVPWKLVWFPEIVR